MLKKTISSIALRVISVLFIFIIVVELTARTTWAQKTFLYHSVGNYHYPFEIKWFRLQKFIEQNGGVDVILLGSSLVNTGIDPDLMAQAYYKETGVKLRIFNFGVEGLTIAPNLINAKILVNEYHPALLIYVTEMRDFIGGNGLEVQQQFLSYPWMQYRQGKFNVWGWAIDHSSALQDYLPYRNWMRADFSDTLYSFLTRYQNTSESGYEPEYSVGENLNVPPDPNDPKEIENFKVYGNFQMDPSRLEDLKSLLSLAQDGKTNVLIVEMPVHPNFFVYVGGEKVHKQFQQTIDSLITSSGNAFIPADTCEDIPLAGRANLWHLNYQGAPIFSSCLGQQLAIIGQLSTKYLNWGGY
jgi:hypothetical protein